MLCRHTSGLEQVLDKVLGKSLEELPLHQVLIRELYHAACMAFEFVIERQSSLTMRELSLSVTVCRILRSNFMYKSFIHATDEVFEVPFAGPSIPGLNFVCVPCRSETGKGSSTKIYPHGVLMVSSYVVHSEPTE